MGRRGKLSEEGPTLEPARPGDLQEIFSLLGRADLPGDGLADHLRTTIVARSAGRIVGTAAVEPYGESGLLRSIAVDPSMRGCGLGVQLTRAALDLAMQRDIRTIYLLTTTAGEFFPRFGFRSISRSEVDPAVQASVEFTSACCAGAQVMRMDLDPARTTDGSPGTPPPPM